MALRREQVSKADLIIILSLVIVGFFLLVLFQADIIPPIELGVIILVSLTVWGVATIKVTTLSLLPRLMIVLYSLPFSTTIGYLFDRDYVWWQTNQARGYIQDRQLMGQLIFVGIIGLIGLIAGMKVAGSLRLQSRAPKVVAVPSPSAEQKSLNPGAFYTLLTITLLLSWLSAPTGTIFDAVYASDTVKSIAQLINFNSAYLISYILLVLLFVDAERERKADSRVRRGKFIAILAVSGFIVVFLQILRGDRESAGLIAALVSLYLTGPDFSQTAVRRTSVYWRRIRRLIVPSALIVAVFISLGAVRSRLSGSESLPFNFAETIGSGLEQATWTAVLLTNLGLAAEYKNQSMEYFYGSTYVDYLVSLPPGIVTQNLGIERAVEATSGPTWWYSGLSAGGIHPVVVPFKNFGAVGVFVILGIFGFLIVRWEVKQDSTFQYRLVYGAVITSSFFWFWYGDMNIIRGWMLAVILGAGYRAWLFLTSQRGLTPVVIRRFAPPRNLSGTN
jgi:hypothetical protein